MPTSLHSSWVFRIPKPPSHFGRQILSHDIKGLRYGRGFQKRFVLVLPLSFEIILRIFMSCIVQRGIPVILDLTTTVLSACYRTWAIHPINWLLILSFILRTSLMVLLWSIFWQPNMIQSCSKKIPVKYPQYRVFT